MAKVEQRVAWAFNLTKLEVLDFGKCKSCKEFKRCVNFADYPAKANDNICPYYVPKKRKERGNDGNRSD